MFRTFVRWIGRASRALRGAPRGTAAEIAELRRRAAEDPSPAILARLAELHRLSGGTEQAIEVAHRAIAAFPDDPAGHVALARIHYGRFIRTAAASDGRAAERSLLQALQISPSDPAALIHLAALYARVGAVEDARRTLASARAVVGEDSWIEEIARALALAERNRPPGHEDPFHAHEAANAGRATGRLLRDGGRLAQDLAPLLEARGVASVAVLGATGEIIFSRPEIEGTTVESLRAMRDAARVSARRMSLGIFGLAGLAGPDGKLVIADRGAATVFVQGDGTSLDDGFEERVAAIVGEGLGPEEIA